MAFLFHQRENYILRFNQTACTANWQQAFWTKHLILYLCIDIMIQSEVYSPGRSLEDSVPVELDTDMSYFSLAHRRLQCKHCKAFPGLEMLMDFISFCLLSPRRSCTSISQLWQVRGDEGFTAGLGWSCEPWHQHWLWLWWLLWSLIAPWACAGSQLAQWIF